jgi:hypothetical protein
MHFWELNGKQAMLDYKKEDFIRFEEILDK